MTSTNRNAPYRDSEPLRRRLLGAALLAPLATLGTGLLGTPAA
ncbi:MAG: hypothetical protein RL375_4398, partial [Pseudomonadota bacterium]